MFCLLHTRARIFRILCSAIDELHTTDTQLSAVKDFHTDSAVDRGLIAIDNDGFTLSGQFQLGSSRIAQPALQRYFGVRRIDLFEVLVGDHARRGGFHQCAIVRNRILDLVKQVIARFEVTARSQQIEHARGAFCFFTLLLDLCVGNVTAGDELRYFHLLCLRGLTGWLDLCTQCLYRGFGCLDSLRKHPAGSKGGFCAFTVQHLPIQTILCLRRLLAQLCRFLSFALASGRFLLSCR